MSYVLNSYLLTYLIWEWEWDGIGIANPANSAGIPQTSALWCGTCAVLWPSDKASDCALKCYPGYQYVCFKMITVSNSCMSAGAVV